MRPSYPCEVEPLPNLAYIKPQYGSFMLPGVYMFHDIDFNRAYIGSSNNLSARWCKHENELIRGVHHNRLLQHAFDNGADFLLSYLLTDSHDEALIIEQSLIDLYYDSGLIYNATRSVVTPTLGIPRSDEAKSKTSAFYDREGVKAAHSEMVRKSWLDDEVRANRLRGLRTTENRECMRDSSRKAWDNPEIRERLITHRRSDDHRNKLAERRSKQVTIDGVEYTSIKIAAERSGINRHTLAWRIRNGKV